MSPRISGHGGNDEVSGGFGDDILDGGAGSEILDGDTGTDKMTGGTRADAFRYSDRGEFDGGALDLITDFDAASGGQLCFFQDGADEATIADAFCEGYVNFLQTATGTLVQLATATATTMCPCSCWPVSTS